MLKDHCIILQHGQNTAWVCAQMGANCVRLQLGEAEVLRVPPQWEALCATPHVYGMPLLLPPNRIADGCFPWQGKTFYLPVNEPQRNNHLHGALADAPFQVLDRTQSRITLRYSSAMEPQYASQGWDFMLDVTYRLHNEGLTQTIRLVNGNTPLPLGLGCHTALNAPFLQSSAPEEMRLYAPALEEWTLERTRILPTGERSVTSLCASLAAGYVIPCAQPLSALFTLGNGCVELQDRRAGYGIRYELEGYPFLMLWNQGGSRSFVCCEPQTWVVDAPHVRLAQDVTGFLPLAPHETRTYCTHLLRTRLQP